MWFERKELELSLLQRKEEYLKDVRRYRELYQLTLGKIDVIMERFKPVYEDNKREGEHVKIINIGKVERTSQIHRLISEHNLSYGDVIQTDYSLFIVLSKGTFRKSFVKVIPSRIKIYPTFYLPQIPVELETKDIDDLEYLSKIKLGDKTYNKFSSKIRSVKSYILTTRTLEQMRRMFVFVVKNYKTKDGEIYFILDK